MQTRGIHGATGRAGGQAKTVRLVVVIIAVAMVATGLLAAKSSGAGAAPAPAATAVGSFRAESGES